MSSLPAVTPLERDNTPDGSQGSIDQFQVTLEVFEGPFDLLLQLIARKRLDITEIALAEVTDEFLAHMRIFPDLSATTEFLVVAATLLDMKAARLLPRGQDEEDYSAEDLEARDLLFSRLLQYRAFKSAAAVLSSRMDTFSGAYPRAVALEPHFAQLLPELVWVAQKEDLARSAAQALSATPPSVSVSHLHDPVVPVREQALIVCQKLRSSPHLTFAQLVADASTTAVVVSRFLALLELFRRTLVEFSQQEALGVLEITWIGGEDDLDDSDFDDYGVSTVSRTPQNASQTPHSDGESKLRVSHGTGDTHDSVVSSHSEAAEGI